MSDSISKLIRSVALYLAANHEPTCRLDLPDGTVIIVEAAQTLQPGETLPAPDKAPALPPVAPNASAPHPTPRYFDKPVKQGGVLNTSAPRYDSATPELRMNHLLFSPIP